MNRLTPSLPRALRAAALLAALAPSPASAQQACVAGETTLRVGDPRLASFTPPADTVDVWIQSGAETRPVGVYTQTVERAEHGGQPAWVIVQHSRMGGRTFLDSITVRAGTFAPLRHVAETPAHDADVRFAGGRATGTLADSANTQPVDAEVSAAAFDHSIASLFLRAIPLCQGLKIRAETYDVTRGPADFNARVVGRERVEIKGRTWDAWVVEVEGGSNPRLYFDPATGRQVGWTLHSPDGQSSMRGANRIHGGGGGGGTQPREMQMRIIDF